MDIERHAINRTHLLTAVTPLLFAFLLVPAGAIASTGYLTDTSGAIVRNDFGECWHTSQWSSASATAQCEPSLASAQEPQAAPEAALESATPVMRKINLSAKAYFGFNKAELNPAGKRKLDEIAKTLRNAHNPTVAIVGHADRIGPAQYNQRLSMRRAEAVKDYLMQQGIPADTLHVSAVGSTQPTVTCAGKHGRNLITCLSPNRRTEVEFSAFEPVQPSGKKP